MRYPFGNLCQRQFWIILRKSFQKCNMLSLYIYTHNMMICIFIFLSNVIIFYCHTRHVQIEFWRIVPLHIDVSWEGRVVQGSPNETTDLDLLSMVSYVHWLIRYIKLLESIRICVCQEPLDQHIHAPKVHLPTSSFSFRTEPRISASFHLTIGGS